MRRPLAAIAILLLATACGIPAPRASALQQFAALEPRIRTVEKDSALLSHDWARLAHAVSRARIRAVRKISGPVLLDSSHLRGQAANVARQVRIIRQERGPGVRHRYFSAVAGALSCQYWEAGYVALTARLLRRDPLLKEGRDAAELFHWSRLARRAAGRAVRFDRIATQLQQHNPKLFRYVPTQSGR